jgi:hypothetical protein
MTWIIGTLSYLGVLFAMLLVGVVLLGCVAIVALLGALPAKAQVALAPGQAMQVCNTVYTTTGGGVTCSHVPEAKTVRMSYHGDSWHRTFWGDGSAASILSHLCRDATVQLVSETVWKEHEVDRRVIPCNTGRATPWKTSKR